MAAGLCPDPLGELKLSPDLIAAIRGPSSKGKGKGGKEGQGGEGRKEGKKGDGGRKEKAESGEKGREERGREGKEGLVSVRKKFWLRP